MTGHDGRPSWYPDSITRAKALTALNEQRLVDVAEQIASCTPDGIVLPTHVDYAAMALGLLWRRPDRSADVLTAGIAFLTSGASLAAAMAVVTVPVPYHWIKPASIAVGLVGLLLCGIAIGMRLKRRSRRTWFRQWVNLVP